MKPVTLVRPQENENEGTKAVAREVMGAEDGEEDNEDGVYDEDDEAIEIGENEEMDSDDRPLVNKEHRKPSDHEEGVE